MTANSVLFCWLKSAVIYGLLIHRNCPSIHKKLFLLLYLSMPSEQIQPQSFGTAITFVRQFINISQFWFFFYVSSLLYSGQISAAIWQINYLWKSHTPLKKKCRQGLLLCFQICRRNSLLLHILLVFSYFSSERSKTNLNEAKQTWVKLLVLSFSILTLKHEKLLVLYFSFLFLILSGGCEKEKSNEAFLITLWLYSLDANRIEGLLFISDILLTKIWERCKTPAHIYHFWMLFDHNFNLKYKNII